MGLPVTATSGVGVAAVVELHTVFHYQPVDGHGRQCHLNGDESPGMYGQTIGAAGSERRAVLMARSTGGQGGGGQQAGRA